MRCYLSNYHKVVLRPSANRASDAFPDAQHTAKVRKAKITKSMNE